MEHLSRTQEGTNADKVRRMFPLMPAQFTIKDIVRHDPSISQPAASSALRWSVKHGLIRIVRQTGHREWRDQGYRGAPPIIYSFIGDLEGSSKEQSKAVVHVPKKRGRTTTLPAVPPNIMAVLQPETVEHQCDATQVIDNVQRALATVNVLIALQKMSTAQAMTLAGTLNTLGDQSKRR